MLEKKKLQSEAKASERTSPSDSKKSKRVDVHTKKELQCKEDDTGDASVKRVNVYECAENLFYCQKCNFGNPSLKGVLNHQSKIHRRINSNSEVKAEYVRMHTSLVLEKTQKMHLKTAEDKDFNHRTLKCHRCAYTTQYLYILRRHLWKSHRSNRSCGELLRLCFKQGNVQSGYHCDMCVFSHKNAATVYKHYQEQHPERKQKFEYISTRLYVGPDSSPLKKKKPQIKKNETKTYSCKACSFKGSSMSGITRHYRAVHPWSVKEDGSVLGVKISKKRTTNSQLKDRNEILPTFDTYQIPLESPDSPHEAEESPKEFKCSFCPASFFTARSLNVHCGMKHQGAVSDKSNEQQEKQIQARVHVFKCSHCDYINSNYQGVLTHCQMKHPALTARADSVHVDKARFKSLDDSMKQSGPGDTVKYRGYMCKTCQLIYATVEKLNKHCEKCHKRTVLNPASNVLKPPPKPSMSKIQQANACSAQGSLLNASFLRKKIYAVVRCQHCNYSCSTKIALSRHLRVHHRNPSGSKVKDCAYKCALCSQLYFRKKHLASHYIKKHGKDAFFRYYVPLYKQVSQKSAPDRTLTPPPESLSEALQSKEPLYECHMCTYTGSCRKYLYCHYKYTHKLDALSIYKRLEKYNKRKRKFPKLIKAKSEESAQVKCKKCPNVTFNSCQLLIAHYSTFHRTDCKLDFTVLVQRTKRSTGSYKCSKCKKHIHGIKNLCCHLDRHRARRMKKEKAAEAQAIVLTTAQETKSNEVNELPLLETVDELAKWNVTPAGTFNLPASPQTSPLKPTDAEQPKLESRDDKHSCKQCRRTFMSLAGLRSHEKSHAALAAIKKRDSLPPSAINIKQYVIYKSGTLRPFRCSFCSYQTTVLGLAKSHFMKKHQDVYHYNNMNSANRQMCYTLTESLYLEPPDVQRQLNQYSLMAQIGVSSKAKVQGTMLPENSLIHCEFCNFNSGHLSSMRRHYLNRHGRKILRCKDCDFFTGIRKTLEMHMEAGHSTFQSEPTYQKDLRCPFCLYQTKNKNNMIDHIVLHREERVVPIEVQRSKLSHYLKGIVFRCHKCTFTSGNAGNLRLHMMRHNDIKPYRCRLCYFDCTQLSDLEAHLNDKHQVVRNHELVGQVSLDQLEATVCSMPEEEHESLSNLEWNNDRGDVETEELDSDCNEKLYTCEFCGRNLMNTHELTRHVMRHGI
uniref:C2H2-type domain-containing protein n=1 Tax=Anabas testudineus TaxID=64144 RepID=A0A7N6A310_ANATE